jgi:hypothetical protein
MKNCRRWKPVYGHGFVQRRTFEERLGGWVVNHPPAPLRQIMPMHGETRSGPRPLEQDFAARLLRETQHSFGKRTRSL